jgi:hypothetical protein
MQLCDNLPAYALPANRCVRDRALLRILDRRAVINVRICRKLT